MTGNSVALDTSVAIDLLAGKAAAVLPGHPTEILLPVPVVGELRYGALNSRRAAANLAEVERLVSRCRVLDVTPATLPPTPTASRLVGDAMTPSTVGFATSPDRCLLGSRA